MKEKIVVLALTAYKFPDEQTGEIREGAHIHYIGDYSLAEEMKKGTPPIKMTAMFSLYEGAKDGVYPAVCELESKTLPNGKGQPTLTPVKLHYVAPIDMDKLFAAQPLAKA